MRIEDVRIEKPAGKPRLTARVIWEDSPRPACDVYFETENEFAEALAPFPDAFLAASLSPALWAGESRIRVDGEVCPELLENLQVVSRFFQHWFKLRNDVARVEARPRSHPVDRVGSGRAAFFFTGGLDSLAALRANRIGFPREHPGSLKDGIIVYGLEVEDEQPFSYVLKALTELAKEAELTLVPVSSNVRCLNPDWTFWYNAHMGPVLCAVAHAFGRRLSSATIGTDYDVPHVVPHGSHPLVEPNFSSHTLKIKCDGLTMSRLAKARLVAEWTPALHNLRVCNKPDRYQPGRLNCGECEKCIRTMLELLAVGAFDRAPVFVRRELSAELINTLYMAPAVEPYYEELIHPLTEIGRPDLAGGIRQALARTRREVGLIGRLRKFDRDRLNGSLASLKRSVAVSR